LYLSIKCIQLILNYSFNINAFVPNKKLILKYRWGANTAHLPVYFLKEYRQLTCRLSLLVTFLYIDKLLLLLLSMERKKEKKT